MLEGGEEGRHHSVSIGQREQLEEPFPCPTVAGDRQRRIAKSPAVPQHLLKRPRVGCDRREGVRSRAPLDPPRGGSDPRRTTPASSSSRRRWDRTSGPTWGSPERRSVKRLRTVVS